MRAVLTMKNMADDLGVVGAYDWVDTCYGIGYKVIYQVDNQSIGITVKAIDIDGEEHECNLLDGNASMVVGDPDKFLAFVRENTLAW